MDKKKNNIIKIILTIVSFLVLIGSCIGIYYMYESTYGQEKEQPQVTITKTKSTE